MATSYNNIHLPKGYEVAIQSDPNVPDVYTDLGVTYNEGSIELTYDVVRWTGSQAEGMLTFIQNMAMNSSFSLSQIELSNINKLMSGTTEYTSVAGPTVSGATQTVSSGDWAYNKFVPIENQNGDGSAITVNSVSGGTDGPLVEDTDYYVGQNAQGKYGIFVIDSATVTTESQDLTLDYDYTPSASRQLSGGSSSVELTPRAFRLRKNLGTVASPKYFTVYIYAAVNEGGLALTFPRFDSTDPNTIEVSLVGQLDTDRSDLDQLFSIVDEYGIQDN